MTDIFYTRQFVIGPRFADNFPAGSRKEKIGDGLFITADNSLQYTHARGNDMELFCFGYILDPFNVNDDNERVIQRLADASQSFDDLVERTHPLGGRWAIVYKRGNDVCVFNDATGMKQVYYTNALHQEKWIGSNSHVLAELLGFSVSKSFRTEFLYADKPGYDYCGWWQPAESSAYDQLNQLVANHYLDFNRTTVHRFWPNKKLDHLTLEDAGDTIYRYVDNTIRSARHRFKLALAVTSGKDSRLLLATCREFIDDVFLFIIRSENDDRLDFTFPQESFLKERGLLHQYRQIPCFPVENEALLAEYEKVNLYKRCTFSTDAVGLVQHFPKDRVAMYAVNSPLIRKLGYFRPRPYEMNLYDWANGTFMGCRPFVVKHFKKWFREIEPVQKAFGYKTGYLYLLEQKLASWNGNNRNEWDIAHDCFEPFNSRELFHLIISVDEKYRLNDDESLYTYLVKRFDEDLLRFGFPQYDVPAPVIPSSQKIKLRFTTFLRKIKLYYLYQLVTARLNH